MKRFILIFILGLLTCFSTMLVAQNTASVPTTFTILGNSNEPSYRDFLKNPVNPVYRGTDVQLQAYSVGYGDAVDSVYYDTLAQISMADSEGEITYDFEVIAIGYGSIDSSLYALDSTATVTLRKRSYRLDSTATVVVWLNQANRNVVDSLGWTFNNNVSVGDKFRVALTYDYLATADKDGRLEVSSRLTDGDSLLLVDALTRMLVTLDSEEHHLHAGHGFFVSDTSVVNNAAFIDYIFVTGDDSTLSYQLVIHFGGSDGTNLQIYEGVVDSTAGDTLAVFNRNRTKFTTAESIVMKAPEHFDTENLGTRLFAPERLGAGQNNGGESRADTEWILKPSTRYMARNTSFGASNVIWTQLHWYKTKNKE